MKFATLLKLVRYLPVIFIASFFLTTASIVQASMMCTKVDELPIVSEPPVLEQLQAHVKTLPGLGSYQIKDISSRFFFKSRFFIVSSQDEKCKETSSCHYRLLDLHNGAVKDVFAFQGSGRVLIILSPTAVWWPLLQDEYYYMEFETRDNTYLGLQLPLLGNTVFVVPQSPEDTKMLQRICSAFPK